MKSDIKKMLSSGSELAKCTDKAKLREVIEIAKLHKLVVVGACASYQIDHIKGD